MSPDQLPQRAAEGPPADVLRQREGHRPGSGAGHAEVQLRGGAV